MTNGMSERSGETVAKSEGIRIPVYVEWNYGDADEAVEALEEELAETKAEIVTLTMERDAARAQIVLRDHVIEAARFRMGES